MEDERIWVIISVCMELTSGFVELQGYVGVDTQRVVVVDHVQGQLVFAFRGVRAVWIRLDVQAPAIQEDGVGLEGVAQNFADGFIGVALRFKKVRNWEKVVGHENLHHPSPRRGPSHCQCPMAEFQRPVEE
jgi:hypothetical protein